MSTQHAAPGNTAPGQAAPGNTAPGQAAPGNTAPGNTAPRRPSPTTGPVALVTGASQGLGAAVSRALVDSGWSVIIDARSQGPLAEAATTLRAAAERRATRRQGTQRRATRRQGTQRRATQRRTTRRRSILPAAEVVALAGDVADSWHRAGLVEAVESFGHLDLLVNNASILGPSPQPVLAAYPLGIFRQVYEVDVVAPLALTQDLLGYLEKSERPRVVNITSDAAVEAYEGWGGYGSAKAALDQLTAVLAAESPWCRWWSVDPGDMRTRMHQEAFPGEDISDRPLPEAVVPAFLRLVESDVPSGRIRLSAAELEGKG